MKYYSTKFFTSVAKLVQLPEDDCQEVAFVGRSNAGKSSALNAITRQKDLAKTSKTPGRTQLINFFQVTEGKYLVDLPGYGYAKVSANVKQQWQQMLTKYLSQRNSLQGLILLMDIRHPLKPFDWQMLEWVSDNGLEVHILLTKSDKVTRNIANKTLSKVVQELQVYPNVSIQLFSAPTSYGIEEVYKKLDTWLD